MNSFISDDFNRENLALETAKCLEDIFSNNKKVTVLHKELLEINLTLTAYIEESKKRLTSRRLDLANEAKSTQKVVEILSDKSPNMSVSPNSSYNRNVRVIKAKPEDNNNTSKFIELQKARTFISWFKHMIDNERSNLSLYLSDDAILEWFGRTVKTRKKLTGFLKHDMQCSRHYFTTIENIEKVQLRNDRLQRKDDLIQASSLHSPEMIISERPGKRKLFQSNCDSPEWAEGCRPPDEAPSEKNICKRDHENTHSDIQFNGRKRLFSEDESEIHSKGDGAHKPKRKCIDNTVTPPNREVGQGDCLPSTSGTDSDRSHDTLNSQLPKLAVECNGYIEFARSRNSRSTESAKWERKCKVQISYSEDPLNIGEYIIWMLRYTDETKCRRNLLAAFEEVAKVETKDYLT